eukprot:SAG31_NODE_5469_length_2521_cov_1.711808_1_plen_219_part_00
MRITLHRDVVRDISISNLQRLRRNEVGSGLPWPSAELRYLILCCYVVPMTLWRSGYTAVGIFRCWYCSGTGTAGVGTGTQVLVLLVCVSGNVVCFGVHGCIISHMCTPHFTQVPDQYLVLAPKGAKTVLYYRNIYESSCHIRCDTSPWDPFPTSPTTYSHLPPPGHRRGTHRGPRGCTRPGPHNSSTGGGIGLTFLFYSCVHMQNVTPYVTTPKSYQD